MAIVKVENKTYTVDPLYQWDKNQVLEIRGLSLAKVPEVHFANTYMDRAIVRPASMDTAGVITVQVPNSLLQKAGRITVFLCYYEGDAFRTLYKLEITVKARPMPGDYTFEDDAGEVYSFNALENKVDNALAGFQTLAQEAQASAKAAQDSAAAAEGAARTAKNAAESIAENVEKSATDAAKAAEDAAKAAEDSAAAAEAAERSILKSDIAEIVKVAELPENPVADVLYIIV